jgi:hypothetical protein
MVPDSLRQTALRVDEFDSFGERRLARSAVMRA